MLVELCVGNYETSNGFVNGVDGIFQDYTKTISKSLIWIQFQNLKLNINTNKIFSCVWKIPRLDKNWTPIEHKVVEIQIVNNPFHTIIRIQFPIQLVATHTIHCLQGLTFDHLTFDPNGVTKHGLTYTTLSKICPKNICIYFLHY
jgi:hypothetical protein